jgi:hypothetical protein
LGSFLLLCGAAAQKFGGEAFRRCGGGIAEVLLEERQSELWAQEGTSGEEETWY